MEETLGQRQPPKHPDSRAREAPAAAPAAAAGRRGRGRSPFHVYLRWRSRAAWGRCGAALRGSADAGQPIAGGRGARRVRARSSPAAAQLWGRARPAPSRRPPSPGVASCRLCGGGMGRAGKNARGEQSVKEPERDRYVVLNFKCVCWQLNCSRLITTTALDLF